MLSETTAVVFQNIWICEETTVHAGIARETRKTHLAISIHESDGAQKLGQGPLAEGLPVVANLARVFDQEEDMDRLRWS